jgi:hypothetical protein
MNIKPKLATILATLIAGSAPPVLAQTTASAAVEQFRYHLIDLAPEDGIAPSLTLTSQSVSAVASQYDLDGMPAASANTNTFGSAGFHNIDGSAHVSVQVTSAGARLATFHGTAYADAGYIQLFTLSPYTEVVFDVDASVAAGAEPPSQVYTFAQLYSGIFDTPGASDMLTIDQGTVYAMLSVSTVSGADWARGSVGFLATVATNPYVPPIPEPTAAAMLAAGLAVVAGVLRRRLPSG